MSNILNSRTTTTTKPVDSPTPTSGGRMDYNTLRNANWDNIDKYYQKLLTDYTNKYQQYTSGLSSTNKNDQEYARYLQSSVNDYKNQLINVYQETLNILDKNDEIIREQKRITEELEKENDKLIASIAKLKNNKNLEATEAQGHTDNKELLDTDLSIVKNWNLYYKIGMGVLSGCVVLMIIYRIWIASITPEYTMTSLTIPSNNTSKNNTAKVNNKTTNNSKTNTSAQVLV
jgi:uncharacterized protein (UPF0305 family)